MAIFKVLFLRRPRIRKSCRQRIVVVQENITALRLLELPVWRRCRPSARDLGPAAGGTPNLGSISRSCSWPTLWGVDQEGRTDEALRMCGALAILGRSLKQSSAGCKSLVAAMAASAGPRRGGRGSGEANDRCSQNCNIFWRRKIIPH